MPATIVVGGQFGSEGKGKVVALTAMDLPAPWVVRCGGPNSGHTTSVGGTDRVLRHVPSAVDQLDATLALAAGCVIDEKLLIDEIEGCGLARERIYIDPRAVLLDNHDCVDELELTQTIGSTGSGNGMALARRLLRNSSVRLAGSSVKLRDYAKVELVAPHLHRAMDAGRHVVVEGTQGFGLSLLHGPSFPYVTSKDTTAGTFAVEAGLSPRHVESVVVVIRTFPIRVGGNSGPLKNELTWADVRNLSGAPEEIVELTSVTRP